MDALKLLTEDHQRVKKLMQRAEKSNSDDERQDLFLEIKAELEIHTYIEEQVFYPALEAHDELKDLVLESYEEHNQVKELLEEMNELPADDETFVPKLKVLMEDVEHHAEEEEEGIMFPMVRKLFSASELASLGEELEAEKNAFIEEENEDEDEDDDAGSRRTA